MSAENPITQSAVDAAVADALSSIASAVDLAALKAARGTTVGEQSEIAKLNALVKNLPNEFKAASGAMIGKARGDLNAAFAARETQLFAVEEAAKLAADGASQ